MNIVYVSWVFVFDLGFDSYSHLRHLCMFHLLAGPDKPLPVKLYKNWPKE